MKDKQTSTSKRASTKTILAGAIGGLILMVGIGVLALFGNNSLQPKYDFLFTNDYRVAYDYYQVRDGQLMKNPDYTGTDFGLDTYELETNGDVVIYRYHVDSNTVSELSLEDAQTLTLSSREIDPDGIRMEGAQYPDNSLFFTFGNKAPHSLQVVLSKDSTRKTLTITAGDYASDPYTFTFLGWVVPSVSATEQQI